MTESVEVAMIRQIRDRLGLAIGPGAAWVGPEEAGFCVEVDNHGTPNRLRVTVENLGVVSGD